MYTAKEIMSSPAVFVNVEQTLQDVIEILAKNRFSGVPVVDNENKVIGVISDTDIIRYSHQVSVVPLSNLSGWISPHADISDLATMRKGFELLHKTKVNEVMTKKVFTIHEGDTATDVAQLMNKRRINRVPVVDDDGKLVGIVTRGDMVQCMAKL
jgi:CBS domain-containing protein